MGLNQNRKRESEVCDNIINQAANEAASVWSSCDFCPEALGSKPRPRPGEDAADRKRDHPPSPRRPQQEERHLAPRFSYMLQANRMDSTDKHAAEEEVKSSRLAAAGPVSIWVLWRTWIMSGKQTRVNKSK